jgi:hypothetical protein
MTVIPKEDDDITIITSNVSSCRDKHTIASAASYPAIALGSVELPTKDAIPNSGATQIFVMEGTPVKNKWCTSCPLKVTLVDRHQVMTTHVCDIYIPGLPYT